ncbi:hypothetical protein HII31_12408 [Pseudocercospora fuligena]|uniref:Uncharacterized protein n=1 Tax=Pseudocercospora fuligena TaxID=685502 RepID=A0A8H6R895_9PEZI|nr:hypothetical protein HII31_12408 [Pseudocercospora fuligena]
MSYNSQRFETLLRLGIEQLPPSERRRSIDSVASSDSGYDSTCNYNIPLREQPVPGKRCPACLGRGQTVWVIPGKRCPQCGVEVN